MSALLHTLKEWLPLLPFVAMVNERRSDKLSVSIARLAEALIIAAASGAIAVYGTTIRLESRFEQLEKNQVRIEVEAKEIKEFARLTRETQLKIVDARGERLDRIDKRLEQLDKRLR